MISLENDTAPEGVQENTPAWTAPADLPSLIDSYINDFIDIELGTDADGLRAASPLVFSSLCAYVGARLRPLSPLPLVPPPVRRVVYWHDIPGMDSYLYYILEVFLYRCNYFARVPFGADFWRFSGFSMSELPCGWSVGRGLIPGWLSELLGILKNSEKIGLEALLPDRRTNTAGAVALLQNRHNYGAGAGPDMLLENEVILADALPVFGDSAQNAAAIMEK